MSLRGRRHDSYSRASNYPRGAYDATVYLYSGVWYAEDGDGNEIIPATGDSFIATQAAIDYVHNAGGGRVFASYGNYVYTDTIVVKENVELIFSKDSIVTPSYNKNVFQIKPMASLDGPIIKTDGLAFTSSCIYLDGTDIYSFFGVVNSGLTFIKNCKLYGRHGTGTGNGIYFECDSDVFAIIYGVRVQDINIEGYEYSVKLYRGGIGYPSVNNSINSNVFKNIYCSESVYSLYMQHGGIPDSDIDANVFENFVVEFSSVHTVTPVIVGGRYNKLDLFIWDTTITENVIVPVGATYNTISCNIPITNLSDFTNSQEYVCTDIIQKVTVHATRGDYSTIADALDAISPTIYHRFIIDVYGYTHETRQITAKSYVEIFGHSTDVFSWLSSGYSIEVPADVVNFIVHNTAFHLSSSSGTACVIVSDAISSNTNEFHDCVFINDVVGSNNRAAIISGDTKFNRCSFVTGNSAGGIGVLINAYTRPSPIFNDCIAEGGILGASANAWALGGNNAAILTNCIGKVGKAGTGASSYCFVLNDGCVSKLYNCRTELYNELLEYSYYSENFGRFRPASAKPYELVGLYVLINVPRAGITLDIGTTVGGSEVLSGIDLGVSGYVSVPIATISSSAYLYATPSSPVNNGDFRLKLIYNVNYEASRALYISTSAPGIISGGHFSTNSASTCAYIYKACNVLITQVTFECHDKTKSAILGSESMNGSNITRCVLIGQTTNVNGVDNKSSGYSEGTGDEQTVPHGLSFTPTRQQVILIAGSATANPYHSKDPDATNIYVTVGSGQAWYWNIP